MTQDILTGTCFYGAIRYRTAAPATRYSIKAGTLVDHSQLKPADQIWDQSRSSLVGVDPDQDKF